MRAFRKGRPDPTAVRELQAIDAALGGESVAGEHARLAKLALELQAARQRPTTRFARALDARAASGFIGQATTRAQRPNGALTWGKRFGWARNLGQRRALLATSLAALLAVAVAMPFALRGARYRRHAVPPSAGFAGVQEQQGLAREPARSPPAEAHQGSAAESSKTTASDAAARTASDAAASAARQVERATSLDLGVAPDAMQSSSQQVFALVSSFGGYVRQSNVSSGSVGQSGASFDLRIPSASLSSAIAALSHLGHLRSEYEATNDATEQFHSLQGSLATSQGEREDVARRLAHPSSTEEIAPLKAQLHALERRISQLRGAFSALEGRVDYASVALTLTAEAAVTSSQGGLTPGGAAREAGQILEAALAVLVIAAAAAVPLGAVGLAAWFAVLSARRHRREQALDAGA